MPRAKGGSIPPPRVNIHPGHGGSISTLNDNDVLSGRGGRINNHPGNVTFRLIVEDYKHEYLDPRTRKLEKAHVAARLVAQIRSTNPPGRFLKILIILDALLRLVIRRLGRVSLVLFYILF